MSAAKIGMSVKNERYVHMSIPDAPSPHSEVNTNVSLDIGSVNCRIELKKVNALDDWHGARDKKEQNK
jgi:hypothetical protein